MTGLLNGASYSFTVVATNLMGVGPPSDASNLVQTQGLSAVALSLSAPRALYGDEQADRLSVTVYQPSWRHGPAPTGTVTVSAGSAKLCTITLSSGHGSCTLSANGLLPGNHNLVATYSSSTLSLTSSSARMLLVETRPTQTVPELSVSTAAYGHEHSVRLVVTTQSRTTGTPTGTVVIRNRSLVICTITLHGDIGSCGLTAKEFAVGTYTIVATYLGDSSYRR